MAYDHRALEPKWQQIWEERQTFRSERRPGRAKFYVLDMFPYPSGSGLHVGHPEGYTATDIVVRYKRARGFDVLHPMGWDAFGLPAEQHAINTGQPPAKTTAENIVTFRRQLKSLGFAYDWSREVDTTDPKYVRWTQWIFLKLFERGLAFQAEIPVNWCPALGTVLANEEVIDGRSERGNHPVVRTPLRQWQLRITAYADRLAEELEPLDWPETRQKQREWIGKSEGAEVDFPIVGRSEKIRVFTTRPDTLFGATYMVIAPDHPLTLTLAGEAERAEVAAYAAAATRKSDLERTALNKQKTGVFTGAYALNPLTQKQIPVYTADYVLGAYGTGAIMAVPAHDERDFEFARHYGLPIVEVVSPDGQLHEGLDAPYTHDGVAVRSGQFEGQRTPEMKHNILRFIEESQLGERKVNYRLRDWVFSRQRYWGEPIPIYFPVKCEGDPRRGDAYEIDYTQPLAVPDSELPLRLPELEDYRPGDPAGPLVKALDWRFFQQRGAWYARETNTMPQWAGSCWYYLRYLDPHNDQAIFSQAAYDAWMPVDLYVGGAEHAVLHLLYARFWHKVLFDIGVVKHPEPFQKLVHQGMILGNAYRWYAVLDGDGKLLRALDGDDASVQPDAEGELQLPSGEKAQARYVGPADVVLKNNVPHHPEHGVRLHTSLEKMAKSRGNVVNPDQVVAEFGADSLRVYEMFMGPLEQVKPWQTSGIQGSRRFLDRVHSIAGRPLAEGEGDDETRKLLHRTVKKVGEDIEAMRFNTAVSTLMILTNRLASLEATPRAALEKTLQVLAPFAPHLCEELWSELGHPGLIADAEWPSYDLALCVDDVIEIGVQVNGKARGRVRLAKDASEETARAESLKDENVAKFVADKALRKFIYVPGKIVNFIVG
ncbi:MAG TPA: leucine--tRNA ligase [Polyangiaceae bacterium]